MKYKDEFIQIFKHIAPQYRRSEVFHDFLTIFGLELYLILYRDSADKRLESLYQIAKSRYNADERHELSKLMTKVIYALEEETTDVLGQLFMALELGDEYKGQFFTPPHVAHLMAKTTLTDCAELINAKGYVSLQEPTCGSGVMIIECFNVIKEQGFNPQETLWVNAQDVDFSAAMMCYIQLALLHIPGEVIVGNSLTGETVYHLYTPAHILGNWLSKLIKADNSANTAKIAFANQDAVGEPETEMQPIKAVAVNELPFEIDWDNEPMFN